MKRIEFKIQELEAATKGVLNVHPNSSLREAITQMITNDFSQLPVMSNERKLDGFISWKTIGISTLFGKDDEMVKDHMDKNAPVVKATENLLESVSYILDKDFVFVRDSTERISGIVTLYDIASQFKRLSEPFIMLQHIETSIRNFIESNSDEESLKAFYEKLRASDKRHTSRTLESTKDLMFGDYLTLIGDTTWWEGFKLKLDRRVFVEKLDKIRKIRNEVMHFRTAGISEEDLKHLKDISKFFRMLESLKAKKINGKAL